MPLRDGCTVQVHRQTNGLGEVLYERYHFACHHCHVAYSTGRRWRIRLSLRVHRYLCCGYRFPGGANGH